MIDLTRKKMAASVAYFDCLNDDMLIEVLMYLDSFDQNRSRAVCMRWKFLLENKILAYSTMTCHRLCFPLLNKPVNYYAFSKHLYQLRSNNRNFSPIEIIHCNIIARCLGDPRLEHPLHISENIMIANGCHAIMQLLDSLHFDERYVSLFTMLLRGHMITPKLTTVIVDRAFDFRMKCWILIEMMFLTGAVKSARDILGGCDGEIHQIINKHDKQCVRHIGNYAYLNGKWHLSLYALFIKFMDYLKTINLPIFSRDIFEEERAALAHISNFH